MPKAILFDFWGTLVENGVKSPIKQVQRILQIDLPFPQYVLRMEKAMMTRKFEQLKNAFESVCAEFKIDCNSYQMEQLIGLWNKSWMLAHPYPEVLEALHTLKQQYALILISNTDNFSMNKVLEKFNLNSYFDPIFLSWEMGMIKTQPEFMPEVLKKSELNPEDCILVGDSIESDMAAAQQNGIPGILVDRRNNRHFAPKILNLRELELML